MPKPFISVLIDTYNHERFIEQALHSVFAQDYPADLREIIVVDDGSTDRTPEILATFSSQIQILRKPNGGQASAFNHAIPHCKGDVVAFLDADDWWKPQKLSRVAEAMTEDPSIGIVGHGIINVQMDGSDIAESPRNGFRFQANTVPGALLFRRRGSFLGTSRMTIRADLLCRIGPIPTEIVIQADEYLFTLAAVMAGVRVLPDTLTYYRLHEGNSFQMTTYDRQKLRRKQTSLAALAATLSRRMTDLELEPSVRHSVIDYTQASADRLRLTLDGGRPWQTVRTERTLYRILHPEANLSHRMFKHIILFGALITPPKVFYRVQAKLAQSSLYKSLRQRFLQAPKMPHIEQKRTIRP